MSLQGAIISAVTLTVFSLTSSTYKIDTCFEVLLSFNVVTSIVYNPLPAMWKS